MRLSPSALKGAETGRGVPWAGLYGTKIVIAIRPMAISTAVPKNGPRHEMPPSRPPTSGPSAIPAPSAPS